ncbi:MAG TPA: hypothetical protein VK013_09495 [Myxococcaceae bacterium]|nr:hypothetical protein [Myxococcaceae bacterium]
MELRRELLLTIGALIALNLLLAFGAIGVLVRMNPAIDSIFRENVASIVAAEQLLGALAEAGDAPLPAHAAQGVRDALTAAQHNITEGEEIQALTSLSRVLPGAIDGAPGARREAVREARRVIRVNREAMVAVSAEARRLGAAGAWASAFVGFFSFVLSLALVIRMQRRFVQPLAELHGVLESARSGDHHRRCGATDAPREVLQVSAAVNRLLDEKLRWEHQQHGALPKRRADG